MEGGSFEGGRKEDRYVESLKLETGFWKLDAWMLEAWKLNAGRFVIDELKRMIRQKESHKDRQRYKVDKSCFYLGGSDTSKLVYASFLHYCCRFVGILLSKPNLAHLVRNS